MRKMVHLGFLLFALSGTTALSAEIYVSPEGKDANPGTKERPLATLDAARIAVRQVKASQREPIHVLLREGTYRLQKPVVFEPADSGTVECPVIYMAYPGEVPIITGGRVLPNDHLRQHASRRLRRLLGFASHLDRDEQR